MSTDDEKDGKHRLEEQSSNEIGSGRMQPSWNGPVLALASKSLPAQIEIVLLLSDFSIDVFLHYLVLIHTYFRNLFPSCESYTASLESRR